MINKIKTPRRKITNSSAAEESGGRGGEELGLIAREKEGPSEPVPYVTTAASTIETTAAEQVTLEVDEVKMEAEDHLAREYVQEFVLDHLDPADVKREVISAYQQSLLLLLIIYFVFSSFIYLFIIFTNAYAYTCPLRTLGLTLFNG